VPPGSPLGARASFFNPNCRNCPANQTPTQPTVGWNGDPSVLNQAPPTQVVPGDSAKVKTSCNDVALQLLRSVNPNTVWQYYRLANTQWPQDPYCGPAPCPVYATPTLSHQGANQLPVNMANAVIETYLMGPPESRDKASCMACHSFATGLQTQKPLDFSFALQEAYPIALNSLRTQRRALALKTGIQMPAQKKMRVLKVDH
ncbi:MAG: hypothetical protein ACREA9_04405, partial [Pyrinomonadaceae bacterium]